MGNYIDRRRLAKLFLILIFSCVVPFFYENGYATGAQDIVSISVRVTNLTGNSIAMTGGNKMTQLSGYSTSGPDVIDNINPGGAPSIIPARSGMPGVYDSSPVYFRGKLTAWASDTFYYKYTVTVQNYCGIDFHVNVMIQSTGGIGNWGEFLPYINTSSPNCTVAMISSSSSVGTGLLKLRITVNP